MYYRYTKILIEMVLFLVIILEWISFQINSFNGIHFSCNEDLVLIHNRKNNWVNIFISHSYDD